MFKVTIYVVWWVWGSASKKIVKFMKTLLVLLALLFANTNLIAQDKIVCKKGDTVLAYIIAKSDSSSVNISFFIDSCNSPILKVPNKYYDVADSIVINIRKRFLSDEDNVSRIAYCYITGQHHLSLHLNPELFPIDNNDHDFFYTVYLYFKDWRWYEEINRLNKK